MRLAVCLCVCVCVCKSARRVMGAPLVDHFALARWKVNTTLIQCEMFFGVIWPWPIHWAPHDRNRHFVKFVILFFRESRSIYRNKYNWHFTGKWVSLNNIFCVGYRPYNNRWTIRPLDLSISRSLHLWPSKNPLRFLQRGEGHRPAGLVLVATTLIGE